MGIDYVRRVHSGQFDWFMRIDIDRSCSELQNRTTWCAPAAVADPEHAPPDKLQTTEQQLNRFEQTLRLMLARGY
jgi:hypothetical protein